MIQKLWCVLCREIGEQNGDTVVAAEHAREMETGGRWEIVPVDGYDRHATESHVGISYNMIREDAQYDPGTSTQHSNSSTTSK